MPDELTNAELDELLDEHDAAVARDALSSVALSLERAIAERKAAANGPPRNAVERHWRERGHELQSGCCRPTPRDTVPVQ